MKFLFKKIVPGLAVYMLLFSCSNQTNSNSPNSSAADSSAQQLPQNLSALFKKEYNLPFVVDTTLLFKIKSGDSLGTSQVHLLDTLWFKHELNEGVNYNMQKFYEIDSVKAIGKYQSWCDSLTIGMTKFCTAHATANLKLDENTLVLIWSMESSSYEACPYFTEQKAYLTVFYNGKPSGSFILGDYLVAGDPPTSTTRIITGKLNADGNFSLDVQQTNDEDMDLPELELVKEHYEFAITSGKISLKKESKEAPVKIKRPKQ